MSPEQRQEWEDDEEALRRETAAAHPAPESTASDERAARVAKAVIEALRARLDLAYRELAEAKREIARLRAGESEDDAPVNVVPTPGQWVKRFNDASADERLAAAERAIANADTVHGHFIRNTNGELIRLRSRAERAEREIAALHRDALAEAQAYRAMFARAQEAEAERDLLAGAMWRARAALGFDNDGDDSPSAAIAGSGYALFASRHVREAREQAKDYSDLLELWDGTERHQWVAHAEAAESKLTAVEALRARYEERAENGCPVSLNYARAHRDLTTALGGGE